MHRWLVVLLLFSGCAFGLSGPDPDRPRNQPPKCDTGKGLVVLDGVVAATSGILALSLAGDTEPAIALLPASIGALYLAGAITGNSKVNRCRAATSEYEQYTAARETLHPAGNNEPVSDAYEEPPLPGQHRAPAPQPYGPGTQPQRTLAPQPPYGPGPQPPYAAQPGAPVPATVATQGSAPIQAAPPPAPAAPAPGGPPLAASAPPVAKAPATKPARPAPPPPPDDDWSSFWREVE